MAQTKTINGKRATLTVEEIAEFAITQAEASIVTKEQVNAEAKRRIYNLVKATGEQSSNERQRNLLAEYSELQDVLIDGGTLTATQKDRRKTIQDGNKMLSAIVLASNVMNAKAKIPKTYASANYWPEGS